MVIEEPWRGANDWGQWQWATTMAELKRLSLAVGNNYSNWTGKEHAALDTANSVLKQV